MRKFKISMYAIVKDGKPVLYPDRKTALIEREKMSLLQPENIYTIDEVIVDE